MRFKDKLVMITGGAQGIGAAAAIADIDLPRAEALVTELATGGGRSLAVCCDVADPASTAAAAGRIAAEFGGVIVNMSSINSFVNLSAYGVSKLAVRGLTTAMATELAPENIRVPGIAPGMMDTESTLAELPEVHQRALIDTLRLVKRQGRREDVVNAMLFFCSAEAAFITGETLIVGRGYPLRI